MSFLPPLIQSPYALPAIVLTLLLAIFVIVQVLKNKKDKVSNREIHHRDLRSERVLFSSGGVSTQSKHFSSVKYRTILVPIKQY